MDLLIFSYNSKGFVGVKSLMRKKKDLGQSRMNGTKPNGRLLHGELLGAFIGFDSLRT